MLLPIPTDISLSDDFTSVLYKIGSFCLKRNDTGLNRQIGRVVLSSPFSKFVSFGSLNPHVGLGSDRRGGVIRGWGSVIQFFVQGFRYLVVRNQEPKLEPLIDEVDDMDFVPKERREIMDEYEQDSDTESLDKELFDLARDLVHDQESPVDLINNFFTSHGKQRVTRSMRQKMLQVSIQSPFSSRNCVACQTEARSIVLIPCGCLCLCNECRENMASRRYEVCPCCRTRISGYSKIFEP